MQKAFVFFTGKGRLKELYPSLPDIKLLGFDDLKIVGITKNKTLLTEEEKPYFILIKDTITLQNPNDIGEEHGNSKDLFNILKSVDEIYLTIHKTNQSNYLGTIQRLFEEKLESHIFHSHITDSIYHRILIPALNNDSLTDLSSLEASLLKEFPNNQLESLIRLHKTLSLNLLKKESISIDALGKQDEYKLAVKFLNSESCHNAKDVDSILKCISSKIIERSKA